MKCPDIQCHRQDAHPPGDCCYGVDWRAARPANSPVPPAPCGRCVIIEQYGVHTEKAARAIAASLAMGFKDMDPKQIATAAYDIAEALVIERAVRYFKEPRPE